MKIIGYSVSRDIGIANSLGEVCTSSPFAPFLLRDYGEKTMKVFASLDNDVAGILALFKLSDKDLEKLAESKKLFVYPYQLTYFPDKFFSIDDKTEGRYANFCDMTQYELSLSNVNETFTTDSLIEKAKTAQETGTKAYEVFRKQGFAPDLMISPANVYRKEAWTKDLPKVEDMPPEASAYAYACCKGNWLECFRRGHFRAWDYDLSCAYASEASKLLHLAYGNWLESKDYQPKADYGYCKCEVTIDSPFSPILYIVDEHRTFTPEGSWETFLTKAEVDFIEQYKLGSVLIENGYWWFAKDCIMPLARPVLDLYLKRQNASSAFEREIIKRELAGSFYGIFIESRGKELGENFCSPWAAETETNTRLKVAKVCIENKIIPIHIAVDGFISDRPMTLMEDPSHIGAWRLSHTGRCIAVSTGVVGFETKQGQGDFSISYEWLENALSSGAQGKKKLGIKTLSMAHQENKLSDIGKVFEMTRTIDLRESKRFYRHEPTSGKELLSGQFESEPWPVEIIKAIHEKPMPPELIGEKG